MAPAPNSDENDNNGTPSNDKSDKTNRNSTDPSSSSSWSSSWFGSWFERGDMRDEIHEQLNQFDERKKRYEEELEERRRVWQSSFPFPFFGSPPDPSDRTNGNHNGNGNGNQWEEFFGGSHGPGHPFGREGFEDFSGNHRNHHHHQRHHKNDDDGDDDDDEYERNIHEIHREMQNLFETAFAGSGMMPPPEVGQGKSAGNRIPFGSLSSSSSTTVVSSANGTSYRMQQDSRNGARIDVQLPRDKSRDKQSDRCLDRDVTLEVLHERPCVIQWRKPQQRSSDRGAGGDDNRGDQDWRRRPLQRPWEQQGNQQVLELGDSVDCSKLSASISEASNILTVEAPIRRKDDAAGEESPASRLPRAVPVSRTD
mmetsp:Transcript_15129/g.42070  ORF Transcript_15129/g.42070 Transcript_15129/m.42070 type:complete len:367 (-) Transcript_15129:1618-2718(-)